MSIKIHHGGNGAYKTSGAIQDDAIPALMEGRTIVTNIRGFTLERAFSVFPDLPESTDIINLSMESLEDMERMRRWFTWVPRGAFIIFDETQLIFLKSWRDKDIDALDYPGGSEAALADDRPIGWLDAWTRHRHWNWDIVLTTPNIKYIRDDIRNTCERAYLHANLALLGIKGRYKETMHDANDNKPSLDGRTIVEIKKIKPETFRLYDSTTTGVVSDTRAGKSIFAQPKILGLMAFVAILLYGVFAAETPALFNSAALAPAGSPRPSPAPVVSGALPGQAPVASTGHAPGMAADSVPAGAPAPLVPPVAVPAHPYEGYEFSLLGVVSSPGGERLHGVLQLLGPDGRRFSQTVAQLRASGYVVHLVGDCNLRLIYRSWTGYAHCRGVSSSPAIASSL